MTRRSLGARTLLFPTPMLIVGTYDADERPNGMAAAWGGVCCSRPPCIAVSLRAATYTHGSIVAGGCFTVSIPSEQYVREADYMGIYSGRDVDKFVALGLTPERAQHVHAPYVAEFPIVLECKLAHTIELGLHTQFVGEVLDVHAHESALDAEGNPDVERILPVISDVGKRRYYGLGKKLANAWEIGRRDA